MHFRLFSDLFMNDFEYFFNISVLFMTKPVSGTFNEQKVGLQHALSIATTKNSGYCNKIS